METVEIVLRAHPKGITKVSLTKADAGVTGPLSIAIAVFLAAPPARSEGHEVSEAHSAQVKERIYRAAIVDAVKTHLETPVAGVQGRVCHCSTMVTMPSATLTVFPPWRYPP